MIPKTHGMSNTKEYACWKSMRRRCNNPKAHEYKYYGGRGITVCAAWQTSFEAFFAHMGFAPTPLHSIERDDVNGNYEPSNCRWATKKEQSANRRPPPGGYRPKKAPRPKGQLYPLAAVAAACLYGDANSETESPPPQDAIMTDAAAKPNKGKPTIRDRAREAICPECGGKVERRSAKGPMPTFCSPECKKTRGNRRLVRGAALIEFLQAWRIDRAQGEIATGSFTQICNILDQFNAEDHAAGRPRADLMAAKILVEQTTYFDRQRR